MNFYSSHGDSNQNNLYTFRDFNTSFTKKRPLKDKSSFAGELNSTLTEKVPNPFFDENYLF